MRLNIRVLVSLPLLGGLASCKSEPSIKFYEEKYGTEATEPISGAFIFVNGRYIKSPYVISRRGLVVYLNDIPVTPLPPFQFEPPDKYERLRNEVPIPPSDLGNMSVDDAKFKDYIDSYWNHLLAQAGPESNPNIFIEEVKVSFERFCLNLPNVRRVELPPSGEWLLIGKDGSKYSPQFPLSCRIFHERQPYTEESQLAASKSDLSLLATYAKNERMVHLIFNGNGGSMFFGTGTLSEMISLLRRERESGMRSPALESLIPVPDFLDRLRKNFVESDQLDQRLEALKRNGS